MLQRLKCLLNKHVLLCSQTVTLYSDSTGEVGHNHECVKCNKSVTFEPKPLEDEYVQMLMSIYGEQNRTVVMNTDPPNYIH